MTRGMIQAQIAFTFSLLKLRLTLQNVSKKQFFPATLVFFMHSKMPVCRSFSCTSEYSEKHIQQLISLTCLLMQEPLIDLLLLCVAKADQNNQLVTIIANHYC